MAPNCFFCNAKYNVDFLLGQGRLTIDSLFIFLGGLAFLLNVSIPCWPLPVGIKTRENKIDVIITKYSLSGGSNDYDEASTQL